MVRKITKDPDEMSGTYYDESEGDFLDDVIVAVHCRDEEEAREVAQVISKQVGIDG